jgi:dTDP-4-amino-4,6-dideoxygalactose transaminase
VARAIPFLDLSAQTERLRPELDAAIARVLDSGQFVMGREGKQLEAELASYLGARFAVGLNSGTDALVVGLRALGVQPGDEVITTPFSFIATASAISLVGARPVFVDVRPDTFNLDPALIERRVTDRTRAILPAHLYGQACDMEPILEIARRRGLRVLEDAAQAIGAVYRGRRAGSLGDAAAFSFYPTKNLGALGDAGMLVTDDAEVAERAALLRNHGQRGEYAYDALGYNSRLDELQAAMLRVKLPHVDEWNAGRRAVAQAYTKRLAAVAGVTTPFEALDVEHVYHQYTVRIAEGLRDRVRKDLERAGIASRVYYPHPLHTLELYGAARGSLPVAEALAREALSLPIWPELALEDVEHVTRALGAALRSGID